MMLFTALLLLALGIAFTLAMNKASLRSWTIVSAIFSIPLLWSAIHDGSLFTYSFAFLSLVTTAFLAMLNNEKLKKSLIVQPLYHQLRSNFPKISETEEAALSAGTISWDGELFSGKPDWDKLHTIPPIILTSEERSFLDGATNDLCTMIDDWDIRHTKRDIPENIWKFVKEKGFLGMLIAKDHGGLGFSAQAQSLIIGKISSRSPDVAIVVMVPNSLGPGELVEKYGTISQKKSLSATPCCGGRNPLLCSHRPNIWL